jgi:hypothetical protein
MAIKFEKMGNTTMRFRLRDLPQESTSKGAA